MVNDVALSVVFSSAVILCILRFFRGRARRDDTRLSERIPAASPTEVCWLEHNGRTTTIDAQTIDVSMAGAGISCRTPIARDSIVYLRFESPGVVAVGRVRHCIQRGLEFVIGLEFTSPLMSYRSFSSDAGEGL